MGITTATLERWLRQGLLVDAGHHDQRFDATRLRRWARRRGIVIREGTPLRVETPTDLVAEAIERGGVDTLPDAVDARAAIGHAVEGMDLPAEARRVILEETLERERLASTGLGRGVALPHPRQARPELVDAARVRVLYLDPAVDWAALDGEPVHTALLLLSPSTPVHLQMLARIAYALRDAGLGAWLSERPSREDLVARLRGVRRRS